MNFEDIIQKNRSCRRFYEDFEISMDVLRKLVGYARVSASSGNIHATIDTDVGIAAQSILLGATSIGLGGCMFGSVNRVGLRKKFQIPRKFQIPLVIALGKPKETIKIEKVDSTGNIVYWRDEEMTHHVPKRSLDELIVDFR